MAEDYMAGWKRMGHNGTGLRKLIGKVSTRRGLESYTAYSLDAAAARMDQLEAALVANGIELPEPSVPDHTEQAYLLSKAMLEAGYDGHVIRTVVWSHYGNEARDAAFARIRLENGKEGQPS